MTGTIPAPPVSTKEQTDTIAGKAQQEKNRNGFPFFIILFAVLALGLLGAAGFGAVRIFQHLNSSPGRAMAYVAGKIVSSPPRLQTPPDLKSVPMISIFVEDQNTSIGRRNIHALKAGNRYTIGGGKSDFLIFLVPLPPHIGELHFDGQQCTFVPKRPEYFPDTGSEMVPNCIGKTIRVLSDNHYQLSFRMERYEDPLKALNRLLNSVNVESALRV
ncbi:hypothetical protein FACS189473_1770 [Spirochaetia bacterium]|nr:hypothetical protein FACS189473_1770 [Spirochaetia bacterium]